MNFTLNRYNIFLILTLFIVVFCFDNGICQNPLDIESRLTPTLEQKENLRPNTENSTVISATDHPTSNPFDIKKEPNAQISKPEKPKESKRIVNTTGSKVGKPIKIGILLALIIFFVLARNLNHKGFSNIIKSLINASKLVDYRNSFIGFLNLQLSLFYLFFFINLAYFIFLCVENNFWDFGLNGPKLFFYILIAVLIIYMVKYIVMMLVEYALDIRRAINNHLFSVTLHNIALGFSLFFINAFFAFSSGGLSKVLMIFGLVLIALFYSVRQLKSLSFLGDLRHFSMLHFFIYLCSCEISPLLVAAKIVIG